jgi:tetratricopeptide (TPR) repeat protein
VKSRVWTQLANVAEEQSAFEDAHEYFRNAEAALKRAEATQGRPQPFARVELQGNQAGSFLREGKLDEAERLLTPLLEEAERTHERDSHMAQVYGNYGRLLYQRRRFDESERAYGKAMAIMQETSSETHPFIAQLWNNIAAMRSEMGDRAGAVDAVRKSIAIREKTLAPDALPLGFSYLNLGAALNGLKDYAGARAALERAIPILRKHQGDNGDAVGYAYTVFGHVLLGEGRPEEAIDAAEKALAIQEGPPKRPGPIFDTQLTLAQALWEARKDPRARGLAEAAERGFAASKDEKRRAEARAFLEQISR